MLSGTHLLAIAPKLTGRGIPLINLLCDPVLGFGKFLGQHRQGLNDPLNRELPSRRCRRSRSGADLRRISVPRASAQRPVKQ